MTSLTIPSVLDDLARVRGSEAAITVVGGDTLTFERWRASSCQVARLLGEDAGVRSGERVLVVCDTRRWVEFAVAYVGVQRAGGVPVPVVATSGPDNVARVAGAAGAVACFGDGPADLPRLSVDEARGRSPEHLDFSDAAEIADINYTSGTTGRPKGVAASFANVLQAGNRNPDARPQVILHAAPPGTAYGQTQLYGVLSAAPYRMVVVPRFNPRLVVEALSDHDVTTLALVPTTARMLVEGLRTGGTPPVADQLRVVRVTGSYIDARDLAALQAAFPGAEIENVYSTTEALPGVVRCRFSQDRPHSVGLPSEASEVRIVDDAGEPVPAGTVGNIELRFRGARRWYVDGADPEADVFRPDGWVRTNDLGHVDDDGFLYITDRKRDVLSVGGVKVGTVAIESVLRTHELVKDAAVVGERHRLLGEVPVGFVVGYGAVDTAAVIAHARGHLANLAPARIVVVDELPLNAMGKPDKKALRRLLAQDAERATGGSRA